MSKFPIKSALAIGLLVCIWGISWPIYKAALTFTPPLLFAGMRALMGGVLLTLILMPSWRKIKWREHWRKYSIGALFNAFFFYGFQTAALLFLPGGLSSVLVFLQPVLVALFAWLWLGEQMSILKMIGMLFGFLGILIISMDGFTGTLSPIGIIIALMGAVSWALGTVYVKTVSKQVDALWLVAIQFTLGGAVLTGMGMTTENVSDIVWNLPYINGLVFGGVFGVAVAFGLYFKLIHAGEAGKIASFTFLVPVIAVISGNIFLKEPFTLSLLTGLALIVLSISLVNYPVGGRKIKKKLSA
ncbi:DMT family transporter [Siminovitchia sediminis]|uniref:DMT family transporter n=1 Tax=Siminovitchia sediminis TaxID=1274353 RepID=A0ABW4KIT9_9BACI